MECLTTQLPDVKLIKPTIFSDERGFFLESWRQKTYDDSLKNGKPLVFVQDNHSRSAKHILRGLHYQLHYPQGKLVRVTAGAVYDVIVDLRKSSSTFGQWQGFHLSAENKYLLWVPPGFAHGFYSLYDGTEMMYKCTEYYHPEDEHTIIWNDPDLAIDWPLSKNTSPLLSSKDSNGVRFKEAKIFECGNF